VLSLPLTYGDYNTDYPIATLLYVLQDHDEKNTHTDKIVIGHITERGVVEL
jgi:hypothetical protein